MRLCELLGTIQITMYHPVWLGNYGMRIPKKKRFGGLFMKVRELLKEKENCYATDKVNECNTNCRFYWSCVADRRQLEIGDIQSREDILNQKCH